MELDWKKSMGRYYGVNMYIRKKSREEKVIMKDKEIWQIDRI